MIGTALAEKSCAKRCGFHLLGLLQTFPECRSLDNNLALRLGFKKIEKYNQASQI